MPKSSSLNAKRDGIRAFSSSSSSASVNTNTFNCDSSSKSDKDLILPQRLIFSAPNLVTSDKFVLKFPGLTQDDRKELDELVLPRNSLFNLN
jgi:hypothetical protein